MHTEGPWRVGDAGHTVFGPKKPDGSIPNRIADVRQSGRDRYDLLPDGTLDFAEDACAVGHFLDARDCKLYPAGCKACYEEE